MKTSCSDCNNTFDKKSYEIKRTKYHFCSLKCWSNFQNKKKPTKIKVTCATCGFNFFKIPAEISKTGNSFCNRSCAVVFNNRKKRKSRRSKAEKMLFDLLNKSFPNLPILANDKSLLDGLEIDIAFPSLKLGIEWNGIVHFKPIFGTQKFLKIQHNDIRKQKIAFEKGIHLIVVPDLVSTKSYVEDAAMSIKQIITSLLDKPER